MSVTRGHSLRTRVRDERGVTLIELLVSLPIGLILLLAVGVMMNVAFRQTAKVNDRVDAVQRGRVAMDHITRTLRSQVCPSSGLNPGAAITNATPSSVTFYADLSGGASAPERRTIAYNSGTRKITEVRETGVGTWPDYAGGFTQTGSRDLLTNADPVSGVPVFRYYAFDTTGVVSSTPLNATPSLSNADEALVVRIATSFVVQPRSEQTAQGSTFQSQVDVRTADPNKPTESPRCL